MDAFGCWFQEHPLHGDCFGHSILPFNIYLFILFIFKKGTLKVPFLTNCVTVIRVSLGSSLLGAHGSAVPSCLWSPTAMAAAQSTYTFTRLGKKHAKEPCRSVSTFGSSSNDPLIVTLLCLCEYTDLVMSLSRLSSLVVFCKHKIKKKTLFWPVRFLMVLPRHLISFQGLLSHPLLSTFSFSPLSSNSSPCTLSPLNSMPLFLPKQPCLCPRDWVPQTDMDTDPVCSL